MALPGTLDPRGTRPDAVTAQAPDPDAGTRRRVLDLVASVGPVTAAELAARLELTTAGIRRHLAHLESQEQIGVHEGLTGGPTRRGRPARRYVVTHQGQDALAHRYSELATQALRFLTETAGEEAVARFAQRRVLDLASRHLPAVTAAGEDVAARTQALATGLSADGYAATARPVPGATAVQLCQGHCPVQDVAHEFPQLCEAEARAFSDLLGVHVQRLATLAGGGHVCTTNIPTGIAPSRPVVAGGAQPQTPTSPAPVEGPTA
ncbi:helix-turn-helix transcriptional regulator [Cellulomonas soli]|nr:helix-turn-helix domain-containing protein [Cellulomonas soli]NYI60891.1 putative ArsR family transcriptional regulator [Cellulomonas soli]